MAAGATIRDSPIRETAQSAIIQRLTTFWYYLGFGISGIACVLPGVVMPAMIADWHLSDHHAGVVLLCVNAGGGVGALCARGALHRRIALGAVILAVAAALWPGQGRWPELPALLWGFGVGMLITSISLVRQRVPGSAATELVRLNFIWALGAFFCAPLMAHALHFSRLSGALRGTAVVYVVFAIGMLLLPAPDAARRTLNKAKASPTQRRRVPLGLVLCTILAPGVEAACGGWLSTYAARYQGSLFTVVAAPTCLWMGLLVSRAYAWLPGSEARLHRAAPAFVLLVVLSALGLLALSSPVALLVFAFLMGFGLGPLYPIFLSRVLGIREGGMIFFLAGLASSVLPYFTGLLSSVTGSLRLGFLTIMAGAVALGLIFFTGLASTRDDERVDPRIANT